MKKGSKGEEDTARLRQQAENVAAEIPQESDVGMDLIRANHELRVHQIELEMQNEELHRAQIALEESRDRYHDLYEFAPLGYFTLDAELQIRAVNLTGADILGRTRPELEGKAFRDFIDAQDSYLWLRHVDMVRRGLGGVGLVPRCGRGRERGRVPRLRSFPVELEDNSPPQESLLDQPGKIRLEKSCFSV